MGESYIFPLYLYEQDNDPPNQRQLYIRDALQERKVNFKPEFLQAIQKSSSKMPASEEIFYYLNDKQYFNNIPKEVWEYHIGGYQVLDYWLKDRKGRSLTGYEIEHYLKVLTALKHTIRLQQKIDKLYLDIEKKLIS